jgi:hypothetical protein
MNNHTIGIQIDKGRGSKTLPYHLKAVALEIALIAGMSIGIMKYSNSAYNPWLVTAGSIAAVEIGSQLITGEEGEIVFLTRKLILTTTSLGSELGELGYYIATHPNAKL